VSTLPLPVRDLTYALRQLRRDWPTALTAVASLALGIGAATAVFSVIHAALIDPYPYPAADRIVRLTAITGDSGAGRTQWLNLTGPQVQQLSRAGVLQSVIAMDYHPMTVTGGDWPDNVHAPPDVIPAGVSPETSKAGHSPKSTPVKMDTPTPSTCPGRFTSSAACRSWSARRKCPRWSNAG
jgi:hypothetical protein